MIFSFWKLIIKITVKISFDHHHLNQIHLLNHADLIVPRLCSVFGINQLRNGSKTFAAGGRHISLKVNGRGCCHLFRLVLPSFVLEAELSSLFFSDLRSHNIYHMTHVSTQVSAQQLPSNHKPQLRPFPTPRDSMDHYRPTSCKNNWEPY